MVTRQQDKTVETKLLLIELIKRGMVPRDLDKLAGFRNGTISQAISRNFPCERTRAKVESVLEFRIWSGIREFDLRMACKRRHSFDPGTTTKEELQEWCRRLELQPPPKAQCAELLATILNHFAASPHRKGENYGK